MFKEIKTNYGDSNKKRNEIKSMGYISSVAVSAKIRRGELKINVSNRYFFQKLKNTAKASTKFKSIYFVVSGTGKWWYKESQLNDLISEAFPNLQTQKSPG